MFQKQSLSLKDFTPYVNALRPHHWTKNLVIFAAPLFAFNLDGDSLLRTFLVVILFCSISSSFYLLNDVVDMKVDRLHPVKCKRPIAAGLVRVKTALIMATALLGGSMVVGWWYSSLLGIILLTYSIIQIAYNLRLKQAPILDIMAIASGFVLRAYAGAVAIDISLSVWFLLCTAMLALFLAVEKRKAELRLSLIKKGTTRAVLKHYSLPLLTRMEGVVTTGTLITYALWSSGVQVKGASTPWMMLTFPFVLYGIFRYQLLSDYMDKDNHNYQTERPEDILLTDKPIMLTIISWGTVVFIILWLKYKGLIN